MKSAQQGGIDTDQCSVAQQNQDVRIWNRCAAPWAAVLLAHGAGAPMDSEFMSAMAELLSKQGLNLVRFEFPYMAQRRLDGRKRPPNPQPVLLDTWRAEVSALRQQVAGPLVLAGKSMGGRMASLVADELEADALICLGYPFYAAGKPEKPRVAHLAELNTPTLIVQGERDALGNIETVQGYALAPSIELCWISTADHDLKPLKRSGLTHTQALEHASAAIVSFLRRTLMHG